MLGKGMRQNEFADKFGLVQVRHDLMTLSHDGSLVMQDTGQGILVEITWNMVGYSGVVRVAKTGSGFVHARNLHELLDDASTVVEDLLAERS